MSEQSGWVSWSSGPAGAPLPAVLPCMGCIGGYCDLPSGSSREIDIRVIYGDTSKPRPPPYDRGSRYLCEGSMTLGSHCYRCGAPFRWLLPAVAQIVWREAGNRRGDSPCSLTYPPPSFSRTFPTVTCWFGEHVSHA
jgi:hypothetical protein